MNKQFEGHKTTVTSVAMMPGGLDTPTSGCTEGPTPLLFVTTAMDCSVKLWSHREPGYPLLSYDDRNDYFVGCDYSPIHPALFASTDLGGSLDFWSLNSDHEVSRIRRPLVITTANWHEDNIPAAFSVVGTHGIDTNRRGCCYESVQVSQEGLPPGCWR